MKNIYKPLSIVLVLVVTLSGCVGAALRGGMTDQTSYQDTLASIPNIGTGKGRVFFYIPKGGPDAMSTLGVIDFISVDKHIFRFGGESYFYLDIDAGIRHVTTTDVVIAGLKNKKQYGKNAIEIAVSEGEVNYLRIAAQKPRAYKLELVPKLTAESEMAGLPLWTNSMTTMTIE